VSPFYYQYSRFLSLKKIPFGIFAQINGHKEVISFFGPPQYLTARTIIERQKRGVSGQPAR
jgi:hypothetical protein